jgi:hypothetical protein
MAYRKDADMSGGVCLPKEAIEKVKAGLDVAGLSMMNSAERRAALAGIVGESNAKWVNSSFETKLLLKNQQKGLRNWASKLTDVSPAVKRDLISRIEKMDKVLDPGEKKNFLEDLAARKLGIGVSRDEAKKIMDMSRKVQEAQAKQKPDGTFPSEADRMAYGYAKVDMGDHLAGLKNDANKVSFKDNFKNMDHALRGAEKVANVTKATAAAMDASAALRQGWKTAMTHPVIWARNVKGAFQAGIKAGTDPNALREIRADIYSRPNAERYNKMDLSLGKLDEEHPTSLPEKIPLAGRLYRMSEVNYNAFLLKTRADLADQYLEGLEKAGLDINDKQELTAAGKLINSLTGAGPNLEGKGGRIANVVLFSPRFLSANINTITGHALQGGITPYARKQAIKNAGTVVAMTGFWLMLADAMSPGDNTEWDMRSSDFGKIKIGNTRFDLTGGQASPIVLMNQLIRNQQKSTTTGVVKNLGEGYGSKDAMDAFWNFWENKMSPSGGAVRDVVRRKNFDGDKPTAESVAMSFTIPISFRTWGEASKDPHGAHPFFTAAADFFGVGANTYGDTQRKTGDNELSATNKAFKAKIGTGKYEEANTKFETRYDTWFNENRDQFDTLPNERKQTLLTAAKERIQKNIYKEYGFTPDRKKSTRSDNEKRLLDKVR